jgi:hypothetical protein
LRNWPTAALVRAALRGGACSEIGERDPELRPRREDDRALDDVFQLADVAGCLAALRIVHDSVIYPPLVGRGLHLHPLAIVVAVLAGVELDGLTGLFLAVPAIAIMSVMYPHSLEWYGAKR